MRTPGLLRVTALALGVTFLPLAAALAGDPAATTGEMHRISAGIKAGLTRVAPAPAPLALKSHPAALRGPAGMPAPAPAHAEEATIAPADTTPDGIWSALLAGNKRFVEDHPRARAYTRERDELAAGQHPRAIVLGCADSRVGPEAVFDQSLGELFVVRTAGNIVDPIALGSIEYAVEHLHAHLLVVLGHTSCGAVKAAAAGGEMPTTCMQAIVDRIRPTVQRLSNCFEGDELVERSVIANARQSATDIIANSALLREAVSKGELRVVSAVYDLHGGVVTPLSSPAATAAVPAPAH